MTGANDFRARAAAFNVCVRRSFNVNPIFGVFFFSRFVPQTRNSGGQSNGCLSTHKTVHCACACTAQWVVDVAFSKRSSWSIKIYANSSTRYQHTHTQKTTAPIDSLRVTPKPSSSGIPKTRRKSTVCVFTYEIIFTLGAWLGVLGISENNTRVRTCQWHPYHGHRVPCPVWPEIGFVCRRICMHARETCVSTAPERTALR